METIRFFVGEYNISIDKQENIFAVKINTKDFWFVGSEENVINFLKNKKNIKKIFSRGMRKFWIGENCSVEGAMPDNSPIVGLQKGG